MEKTADPISVFAPGLFAGKTALVTGGGRGIGAATALAFARLGAQVVIASRTAADLEQVAATIRALGADCLPVVTNIRDIASVDALQASIAARFSAVDFLVNNAGGQFMANPLKISDNGWRSVVDLNLNGTWNMISRFMRPMMERGSGAIVNVVHAFGGERGAPMFAHSGAARAGVINLTRSLAPYLEERGVTINALGPGVTISEAAAKNYGMSPEEWRAKSKRTRCADPEDIAAIILFLCSPAARMMNGSLVMADAAGTQHNWPPHTSEDLFDEVQSYFAAK